MDSNVVIALVVAGVGLTSVIAGFLGTYFVQKKTLERQRKWALEDDGKRIKRELISKRLDVIEEACKIMRNQVGRTASMQAGLPMFDDAGIFDAQEKRLQGISGEAFSALIALDSKELTENYATIARAYGEYEETGTVNNDLWDKAHQAYIDIIRLTDEMRVQG